MKRHDISISLLGYDMITTSFMHENKARKSRDSDHVHRAASFDYLIIDSSKQINRLIETTVVPDFTVLVLPLGVMELYGTI